MEDGLSDRIEPLLPPWPDHRILQVAWALLYAHVFALLVPHRFLTERHATRHRLRVVAVVPEGRAWSASRSSQHLTELGALGEGSARLQNLAVGTRVVAEGRYRAMTAARRTRRDVLFIADGVGITTKRTLFETLTLLPGQDLALRYPARDPKQLLSGTSWTRSRTAAAPA